MRTAAKIYFVNRNYVRCEVLLGVPESWIRLEKSLNLFYDKLEIEFSKVSRLPLPRRHLLSAQEHGNQSEREDTVCCPGAVLL